MRYVRLIGGVLVLCVVATAARGEQLVLTGPDQTQDTMIRKSSPDDNHNNAWQVIIQKNFDKYLLRFDLSALPAGAVINSATLELTVNRVWAGGTVAARRVTESWTETGATWNSRDGVTAWTTAGGSSDSTNAASVSVTAAGKASFDVKKMVQEWAYGTENDGFLVDMQDASGGWTQVACRESEFEVEADRPKLTIDYSLPTLDLTGPDDTADTMLRKAAPDENFDHRFDQMIIQRNQDKAVLWFDLSDLPAGSQIHSAKLELTVNKVWTGGPVKVARVTEPWSELFASWNSRNGENAWATAGGSSDAASAVEKDIQVAGRVSYDVKAIVQSWSDGIPNNGFHIYMEEGPGWAQIAVRESEHYTASERPSLVVQYTPPAANPTTSLSGPEDCADTMIRLGSPDENFDASGPQVIVQRNHDKFLLKYDLSSIPQNAVIDQATLYFTVNNVWTGGDMYIRQVLKPWTETGATWNSASAASPWGQGGLRPGEDYVGVPIVTIGIQTTGQRYVDVKELVQRWVTGTDENHGLLFDMGTGATWRQCALRESEYSIEADRPRLDITWHEGPALEPKKVEITTAASSVTSPAQVEGTVGFEAETVQVEVNGGAAFDAVRLSPTRWYADNSSAGGAAIGIGLAPDQATSVKVSTEADEKTVNVAWTPTDLTGKSPPSDSVIIRVGDSLLLTATGAGDVLEVDADGDGNADSTGVPGDMFPTLYEETGVFTATAWIDEVEVGSLAVVVVDVTYPESIASQVGYTREAHAEMTPSVANGEDLRPSIDFESADEDVMELSLSGLIPSGFAFDLLVLRTGEPTIVARLGEGGPIISKKVVDDFTLEVPARTAILVNDDTDVGGSKLIIRPHVPGLVVRFDMFASQATFAGGATELETTTDEFEQVLDPATGETIGVYEYDIEVPPAEDMYCFDIEVSQAASEEQVIGESTGVNGGIARAKLTEIFIFAGGANQDLTITVTKAAAGVEGSPFEPKISGAAGPTFSKTKNVDCAVLGDYVQTVSCGESAAPGKYDVVVDKTNFYYAIIVGKLKIEAASKVELDTDETYDLIVGRGPHREDEPGFESDDRHTARAYVDIGNEQKQSAEFEAEVNDRLFLAGDDSYTGTEYEFEFYGKELSESSGDGEIEITATVTMGDEGEYVYTEHDETHDVTVVDTTLVDKEETTEKIDKVKLYNPSPFVTLTDVQGGEAEEGVVTVTFKGQAQSWTSLALQVYVGGEAAVKDPDHEDQGLDPEKPEQLIHYFKAELDLEAKFELADMLENPDDPGEPWELHTIPLRQLMRNLDDLERKQEKIARTTNVLANVGKDSAILKTVLAEDAKREIRQRVIQVRMVTRLAERFEELADSFRARAERARLPFLKSLFLQLADGFAEAAEELRERAQELTDEIKALLGDTETSLDEMKPSVPGSLLNIEPYQFKIRVRDAEASGTVEVDYSDGGPEGGEQAKTAYREEEGEKTFLTKRLAAVPKLTQEVEHLVVAHLDRRQLSVYPSAGGEFSATDHAYLEGLLIVFGPEPIDLFNGVFEEDYKAYPNPDRHVADRMYSIYVGRDGDEGPEMDAYVISQNAYNGNLAQPSDPPREYAPVMQDVKCGRRSSNETEAHYNFYVYKPPLDDLEAASIVGINYPYPLEDEEPHDEIDHAKLKEQHVEVGGYVTAASEVGSNQEPIDMLVVDFVTLDENGAIVPIGPEPFEGESFARPVVKLDPVDLAVDGPYIQGTVEGTVWDAFADMVDGEADIEPENIKVYANGELTGVAEQVTKVPEDAGGAALVRPYAHRTTFSVQVSFLAENASNEIEVEVTNAAGRQGFDTVLIPTARSNPDALMVSYTAHIAVAPAFGVEDTIKFFVGNRVAQETDPDFPEVAEDENANESVFERPEDGIVAQLVIRDFTGLAPSARDSFTGTVRQSYDSGNTWEQASVSFVETDNDSRHFLGTLVSGGDPGSAALGIPIEADSTPADRFAPFLVRVSGLEVDERRFGVNGVSYNVVDYEGQKLLGLSPPAVFSFIDPDTMTQPNQVNFFAKSVFVTTDYNGTVKRLYHLSRTPRAFVAGEEREPDQELEVRVSVLPAAGTRYYGFETGDLFQIVQAGQGWGTDRRIKVEGIRPRVYENSKTLVGKVAAIDKEYPGGVPATGMYDLLIRQSRGGGVVDSRLNGMFRVVDKVRVGLVFDDGPDGQGDLTVDGNKQLVVGEDGIASDNNSQRVYSHLLVEGEKRYGQGNGIAAEFNTISHPSHIGESFPQGMKPDGTWTEDHGHIGRELLRYAGRHHLLGIHGGPYGPYNGHHFHIFLLAHPDSLPTGHWLRENPIPYAPHNTGARKAQTTLEWNMAHCKYFLENLGDATSEKGGGFSNFQPTIAYVRPAKWSCDFRSRGAYQGAGLGIAGKPGYPLGSDAKRADGGWPSGGSPEVASASVRAALRGVLARGHSDVIVTLHDFNEKTARILPEYIEAIERTIYQELGVAWQADIGQRKSLVEFIQDRGELRELFDERIRQGFFHKFPDYPDMNFPTWQP